MDKIVEKYCEAPSFLRRPMWRIWHNLITRFDKQDQVTFMNYGYVFDKKNKLALEEKDEINRYCINLYHRVASQVDLKDKNVLEVGSGRGGGASYIKRYLGPQRYTAVDISSNVINFCRQQHQIKGLEFYKGKAEDLSRFKDETFDAVINVESARCYSDVEAFFAEVHRVLEKNGNFLFADMIKQGEQDQVEKELEEAGFSILDKNNINDQVVQALDLDYERRDTLIKQLIPGFLKGGFKEFAGAKGTKRYRDFSSGKMEYWVYKLSAN